ncbi:MAG: ATP-binding protein, partial [Cyclobacteriaceae bacterium]
MKISMSWSGGKDSALALYWLLNDTRYEVAHLHCVIDEATDRIPMHEVSLELIKAQADSAGLPLKVIRMPPGRDNHTYEARMQAFVDECLGEGVEVLAYGDIFLEDLKQYREKMLAGTGLQALFPLWKQPTGKLITEFTEAGFKTCICAVNERYLEANCLGETIGRDWTDSLPAGAD